MNRSPHARKARHATAALAAVAVAAATLLATVPAIADPTPTATSSTGSPATQAPTQRLTQAATEAPTRTATETPTQTPAPTETPTPTESPAPTETPTTTETLTPSETQPTGPPATQTQAPSVPEPPRTAGRDQAGDGVLGRADAPSSTPEEVAARREQARRLAAEIADQEAGLEAARQAVDELATRYFEALRRKDDADARRTAAVAEQAEQERRLQAARVLVDVKQRDLRRWASATYRSGTTSGRAESWVTLLESERTDDLAQDLQMLRHVGRWRGSVVDTVEEAEAVQEDAASRATQAGIAATTAAWQAMAAAASASALLEQQRLHVALMVELAASGAREAGDAAVRQRMAVVGQVGSCVGADLASYPNGRIPLAALCPLWAAPGAYLRADAAHAFAALSEAYAASFGDPLCVTDSYRTFDGQVSLYATRPSLAARPGTSNHGWGTALDLCGGIQTFGTAEHVWMQATAPMYGFVHPTWARAGGSRPEPWHWEYQP